MEDFAGAYLARKSDIFALPRNQNHAVAIFHLGGIAIECRLKAMLLAYHRITNWNLPSQRTDDNLHGLVIKNPSHDLLKAVQNMSALNSVAMLDSHFFVHLENIKRPLGSTNPDYISLRYIPNTQQTISTWQYSFNYINQWLQKNNGIIL